MFLYGSRMLGSFEREVFFHPGFMRYVRGPSHVSLLMKWCPFVLVVMAIFGTG
jgi:hypothetical protein